MKKTTLVIICIILLIIGLLVSANAVTYQIRELTLSSEGVAGLPTSWANSINNSGHVAGVVYDSTTSHAAVTNAEGKLVLLDAGYALAINNLGQAAGQAGIAAIWSSTGTATYPILPSGSTFSEVCAINDSGRAVGECWLNTTSVHNYIMIWDPGAEPVNLGEGCANAVNTIGSVAGFTKDANSTRHAFLWTQALGMTPLDGSISSEATALNDQGLSAGNVSDTIGKWACVWDAAGNVKLLDNLTGSVSSEAYGINESGAVVGSCETNDGMFAMLWEHNGSYVNLGMLPGDISSVAYGINDFGQICGCSIDTSGTPHAVVWDPVPEPASVLALLAGLIGLLPRLRRQ